MPDEQDLELHQLRMQHATLLAERDRHLYREAYKMFLAEGGGDIACPRGATKMCRRPAPCNLFRSQTPASAALRRGLTLCRRSAPKCRFDNYVEVRTQTSHSRGTA